MAIFLRSILITALAIIQVTTASRLAAAACASNGQDYRSPGEIQTHENYHQKLQDAKVSRTHYTSSGSAYIGTKNFDGSPGRVEKHCTGPSPGTPGSWTLSQHWLVGKLDFIQYA